MTEDLLNTSAIIFEVGLPIIISSICFMKPDFRKFLLPVLGALTPLLVAYLYSTAGYYFISRDEYEYGFLVMWVMSFFIYCLLVMAGLVVGFTLRNRLNNYWRYFVGLVSGPLVAVVFLGVEQAFA